MTLAFSRDARKIFRLGKSINEIKTINDKVKDLLWQENKIPIVLDILSRLGFLFYWLFDNISILGTIKFINVEVKPINKIASLAWTIGLLFGLVKNVMELLKILKTQKADKNFDALLIAKLLDITSKIGDLLVSLNGMEVPHMVLGRSLSESVLGMGGLTSSAIAIFTSLK